jgi:uncharacterized protein YhjY with autotransporter beta-barrel domain
MDEVLCPVVSTRATRRICNSTAFFTSSAALTVTLGLIVSPDGPARAQTIGPGTQPAPTPISSAGTNQPAAADGPSGNPGAAGGAPLNLTVTVAPQTTWSLSAPGSLLSTTTTGGNGGFGGDSTTSPGNGGDGGAGSFGGTQSLTIGGGALIKNIGAGNAVSMSSLGGTGGDGGMPANFGTAGEAGIGGDGGQLTLTFAPSAQTSVMIEPPTPTGGSGSAAIQLASQGGNGGNGGSGTQSKINTAVGRAGGAAGAGGNITVQAPVTLDSSNGSGLIAVSTGGNGGNGGLSGSDVGNAVGGAGGAGGSGGIVEVILNTGANITATGTAAEGMGVAVTLDTNVKGVFGTTSGTTSPLTVGIGAQSVGGLGGFGSPSTNGGGAGGAAGAGGNTLIFIDGGTVTTSQYAAVGALAMSVGGAGGSGAAAAGTFHRDGGNGGIGGDGGIANISLGNSAAGYQVVQTSGQDSDALVALSVGGGGGYGGKVIGGGAGITISLGGQGGNGGDGGQVIVGNGYWMAPTDGGSDYLVPGYVVSTTANFSRGIVAESVGGGGGRGGDASGIGLGVLSLSIGGNGGTGGTGGTVNVDNYGIVQTGGDHSSGIYAQSVGGGGGSGGAATAYDVGSLLTVSVAVGGTGGAGGYAGIVTANNFKQVITSGSDAYGIVAQSVGGGGGIGGASLADSFAINPPEVPTVTLTASIGGKGGSGGYGGVVDVLNAGLINTAGIGSGGVFGQSVGGGGGLGGDSSATSFAYTQSKITLTAAIGGSGGTGGYGGAVTVLNSGLVTTLADLSPGLEGQSIGGGGGTGGWGRASTSSHAGAGNYSMDLTLSVGGAGGTGGNGGAVTVDNYVDASNYTFPETGTPTVNGAGGIYTHGDASDAIFAQSVGGGGGVGGGAIAQGSGGQITVTVAVGGAGGAGGSGGAVTVNNGTGAIVTSGAGSAGIFAQSVGGGGGKGGSATTGSGNDPLTSFAKYLGTQMATDLGNQVTLPVPVTGVINSIWDWKDPVVGAYGDISAANDRLDQIRDGYNTLNDAMADDAPSAPSDTNFTVDIGAGRGGNGGAAGAGGVVTVTNAGGSIETTGPGSPGISAQSIGGGGGIGGTSNPGTSSDKLSSTAVSGSIGVGGGAGTTGNGGLITIDNSGVIMTSGDLSQGIIAQSVGGGGGSGGATALGTGLGSGGGLGGTTVAGGVFSLVLGGTDGASGVGGQVTVTNSASIITTGNESAGVMAQSIGGGGGLLTLMGATYDTTNGKMTSQAGGLPSGATININIDGGAGNGSNGGAVIVNLQSGGTIATSGTNSYGILGQSVGGGGGVIVAGTSDVNPDTLFLHAPPSGFVSANGGDVTVTTQGQTQIKTTGAGAVGILAQSIGGGGGIINGMDSLDLTHPAADVPANRQQTGQGGDVTVNNSSDIITSGVNAHGIFAQSVGQGGGVIGQVGGGNGYLFGGSDTYEVCGPNGTVHCVGNVTVNLNSGTIYTSGAGSYGVYIDSQGNGSNDAALNLNSGRIVTSGKAAAAAFLNGAGSNTIVNNGGVIDASQSQSDVAIGSFSNRKATITNSNGGTITGSVNVGVGSTFDNNASATFNAGSDVNLGTGGVLTNSGVLNVGASGKISSTAVTGNFVQAAGGTLIVDANLQTGQADMVAVSGSANIAGVIIVQPSVLADHAPITVLTAGDGVSLHASVSTPMTAQSTVFSFATKVDGNSLQIQPMADFTTPAASLGSAQQAVAAHLQAIWNSGSSMSGGFTTLASVRDPAVYATDLTSLSGQTLGAIAAIRYQSSQDFVANLYGGCPNADVSGSKSGDSCGWARITDSHSRRDMTSDVLGYSANAQSIQFGTQNEVARNLFIGGLVAYEMSDLHGDEHSSDVDGKSAVAGATVRYLAGQWQFMGAIDANHGWYDTTRHVSVGTMSATASASPTMWSAGLHARIAYDMPQGNWYAKPFVNLHAIYLESNAYTENGAGAFDLTVARETDVALAGGAGIELGGNINFSNGASLHPFISAAGEYLGNSDWAARARFVDQPASQGFRTSTPLPNALAKLAVGADLVSSARWDVRLQYSPDFGRDYFSQMGELKFDLRF